MSNIPPGPPPGDPNLAAPAASVPSRASSVLSSPPPSLPPPEAPANTPVPYEGGTPAAVPAASRAAIRINTTVTPATGPATDTTLFGFRFNPRFVPASAMAEAQNFGFYNPPASTVNDELLVEAKAASQASAQVANAAGPVSAPAAAVPTAPPPHPGLTNPFGPVYLIPSPLRGNMEFTHYCAENPYVPTPSPAPSIPPDQLTQDSAHAPSVVTSQGMPLPAAALHTFDFDQDAPGDPASIPLPTSHHDTPAPATPLSYTSAEAFPFPLTQAPVRTPSQETVVLDAVPNDTILDGVIRAADVTYELGNLTHSAHLLRERPVVEEAVVLWTNIEQVRRDAVEFIADRDAYERLVGEAATSISTTLPTSSESKSPQSAVYSMKWFMATRSARTRSPLGLVLSTPFFTRASSNSPRLRKRPCAPPPATTDSPSLNVSRRLGRSVSVPPPLILVRSGW